jgi:hypothetical protein
MAWARDVGGTKRRARAGDPAAVSAQVVRHDRGVHQEGQAVQGEFGDFRAQVGIQQRRGARLHLAFGLLDCHDEVFHSSPTTSAFDSPNRPVMRVTGVRIPSDLAAELPQITDPYAHGSF